MRKSKGYQVEKLLTEAIEWKELLYFRRLSSFALRIYGVLDDAFCLCFQKIDMHPMYISGWSE